MMQSNTKEAYKCTNTVCIWGNHRENVDWGYLTKITGDCKSCIDRCDEEQFCQAVECGNGYCSWWKNNKCIHPYRLNKEVQTCTKTSFSNGRSHYS